MKTILTLLLNVAFEALVKAIILEEGKNEDEARQQAIKEINALDDSGFQLWLAHKAKKGN